MCSALTAPLLLFGKSALQGMEYLAESDDLVLGLASGGKV